MPPVSPLRLLSYTDCSAFLISNLVNIRYLTGLDLSAGLVLLKGRTVYLFVDGRYAEVAKKEAR